MSTKAVLKSLLSGIFAITSALALAHSSNQDSNLSEILGRLQAKGYTVINNVELKGDNYRVKGYTKQGQQFTVSVNKRSSQVAVENKATGSLNLPEIVSKLQSDGYHDISKIDFKDDYYSVSALDSDNHRVNLDVALDGSIQDSSKPVMAKLQEAKEEAKNKVKSAIE